MTKLKNERCVFLITPAMHKEMIAHCLKERISIGCLGRTLFQAFFDKSLEERRVFFDEHKDPYEFVNGATRRQKEYYERDTFK